MSAILVTGATGRLGRLVVGHLLHARTPVRVLTRQPGDAAALFGEAAEIAWGEFADRRSLRAALAGIDRLLLLSPLGAHMERDQIALIDVATEAGVRRIVKISGSHWTIRHRARSIAGSAHEAVERHLAQAGIEHVALRPNAWMQVGLAATIREAARTGRILARFGTARVSHIDARDIAEVAAHQLLAPSLASSPLTLTGEEALGTEDIARLVGERLGRRVTVADPGNTPPAPAGEGFEARAVVEFGRLIADGHAAERTGTLAALLERSPRRVAAFVAETVAHEAAGLATWPEPSPRSAPFGGVLA